VLPGMLARVGQTHLWEGAKPDMQALTAEARAQYPRPRGRRIIIPGVPDLQDQARNASHKV